MPPRKVRLDAKIRTWLGSDYQTRLELRTRCRLIFYNLDQGLKVARAGTMSDLSATGREQNSNMIV